jgi:hypothetical protein
MQDKDKACIGIWFLWEIVVKTAVVAINEQGITHELGEDRVHCQEEKNGYGYF